MTDNQQINIGKLLVIGAITGLVLIVLVIGVQGWYLQQVHEEISAKWDNTPIRWLADLKKDQVQKINSYRWIDQPKQIAAIPIDEAMKRLIANNGRLPSTKPAGAPAAPTKGATSAPNPDSKK